MRTGRGCVSASWILDMLARVFAALILVCGMAAIPVAKADGFPTGPITVVVPLGAGGGTDAVARVIATALAMTIGQSVVVVNRAGAAGAISTRNVAHAAPDGYTMLLGGSSNLSVLPAVKPREAGYDIFKDFAPIGIVYSAPNLVVVRADLSIHDLKERVAYAKAQPGVLNFGSSGVGSRQHLGMELFKSEAGGINILNAPYKGNGEVTTAMMSNVVQCAMSAVDSTLPYIRQGSMRAIAVTGEARLPVLPNVETTAQAGYPDLVIDARVTLLAPKGTPQDRLTIIRDALKQALATPAVRDFYARNGATIIMPDAAAFTAFTAFYRADQARFRAAGRVARLYQGP